MIEINGLDALEKRFDDMARNAQKVSSKGSLSFDEIFTDSFMRTYTKSSSLNEFFNDLNVHNATDFKKLPQEQLDSKVQKETPFNSFKEMQSKAVSKYLQKTIFG
ncbi:hypothetical protein NSA03_02765 [Lactobacillus taiwanensis]|uniref:hypothetical protein n=1 Tax=Lactobacillus taiwanensis TaxID=508451 RepID=UPI00214A8C70|nr:hypothetical protein [Lactobacillus taiwanensis]MCR1916240.1 hypothetical protein [Lactobacillus taiwanensis]